MTGWLKVPEASKYSGVSPRTLREWLKSGLRHSKLPTGTVLIRVDWIDEFLSGFEANPNEEKERIDAMVDDLVTEVLE